MSAQAAAWDQGAAAEPAISPKEHGRLMARLIPLFRVRQSIHVLLQSPVACPAPSGKTACCATGSCRGCTMRWLMLLLREFAEPTLSATAATTSSEDDMYAVRT